MSQLNSNGNPSRAIWAIVAVSALIPFLGRTAIGWIVDVTTLGATMIYAMLSHAVYKHAKETGLRREQLTGIIGFALMTFFLLLLLIPGLLPFDAMKTESYALLIVWSVLGLAYYRHLIHKDQSHPYGQRIIVWIKLPVHLHS